MLCQSVRRDVHIADIDGGGYGGYDHVPSPVWVAAGLGHDKVILEFARFGFLPPLSGGPTYVGDRDLVNQSVCEEQEDGGRSVYLSPLGNAAREGHASTVFLLLRLGAEIQDQGHDRLGPGEESLADAWRACATPEERLRVEAKGKAKADAKAAIVAAESESERHDRCRAFFESCSETADGPNIDIEPGDDFPNFDDLPRTVARRAGHVALADYLDAVYAAGCYSPRGKDFLGRKSLHFKCFLKGPRLSLVLLRGLVRSGRATMRTSTILRSSRQSRLMWLFKDLPDDLFVCIVRQWWTGEQLF